MTRHANMEALQRALAVGDVTVADDDLVLLTSREGYTTVELKPVAARLTGTRRITLDYPPSSNRYWRVYNNHVVRDTAAKTYIRHVALVCSTAGLTPLDGDVCITLRVYRPRRAGDLDNRVKICLDALQGYAYHNDNQVTAIHATRHDDKDNPRVEIEIMPL